MTRKHIIVTIAVSLSVATGFAFSRLYNTDVGFTYYEPTFLPPGISIKTKRISMNKYAPTQVEQNFRTEDWVYTIREYRAIQEIGDAEQNYDAKSIHPTCSIENSPKMTKYRLCHWIDYDKIDVHEIKFIKNGTFIDIRIPTNTSGTISIEDINKFIDSFHKKSTNGLPVLRTNGA